MSDTDPSNSAFTKAYFTATSHPTFETLSPPERIQTLLSIRTSPKDTRFLTQFLEQDVSLLSCTQTSPQTSLCQFKFPVTKFYCNPSGNLHGGFQATIYDLLTSLAVQAIGTRKNFWLNAGVSRNLDVTFLRPAPEGTVVICEVELMSLGRTLAFTRGVMRREGDGAVISVGKHDKAAVAVKEGFDVLKSEEGRAKL